MHKSTQAIHILSLAVIVAASACSILKPHKPAYRIEATIQPSSAFPIGHTTAEHAWDLIHLHLLIEPDLQSQCLRGVVTWTLSPYAYPQNTLALNAQHFIIDTVFLQKAPHNLKLSSWQYDSSLITLNWDRYVQPSETLQITIHYRACFNHSDDRGYSIAGDQGFYFIDPEGKDPFIHTHIWTQGQPEWNSRWFPTIDKPNQKHTQQICIVVPENNWVTLSNGTLLYSYFNEEGKRVDCWEQIKPHSTYLVFVAAGPYHIVTDTATISNSTIDIQYYVFPEYKQFATRIFSNTPEILKFFSRILNYPYPWDKYAQIMVVGFSAGAMENTTATLFGANALATHSDLLDRSLEIIVVHELFHHWFGDLVTCEDWSQLVLNESFADYSEYIWLNNRYGKVAADIHRYNSWTGYLHTVRANPSAHRPLVYFNYPYPDAMFDVHSYNKGGLTLYYLNWLLGDSIFFKGLNLYLARRAYNSAEIHHLRLALEDVSGKDLRPFFDSWFFTAGHPIINASWHYSDSSLELTINQHNAYDTTLAHLLTFSVEIYTSKETIRTRLSTSTFSDTWQWNNIGKVKYALIDPEGVLPAEVYEQKPLNWLIEQSCNSGVIPAARALKQIRDSLTNMTKKEQLQILEKLIACTINKSDLRLAGFLLDKIRALLQRDTDTWHQVFHDNQLLNQIIQIADTSSLKELRLAALKILPSDLIPNSLLIKKFNQDSIPAIKYSALVKLIEQKDTQSAINLTYSWLKQDTSRTTWLYAGYIFNSISNYLNDSSYINWLIEAIWRYNYDYWIYAWDHIYLNAISKAKDSFLRILALDTFVALIRIRHNNHKYPVESWLNKAKKNPAQYPYWEDICQYLLARKVIDDERICVRPERKRKGPK